MNKKITVISLLSVMTAAPAIAAPSHSSNEFPSGGVMEEDYTYVGQANVTNLKVSSGTATTTASYQQCPEGWRNTEANATSLDQCYKPCEVSDLPANSHAATATGNNYYGANVTDTCAIATCNTGYTLTNHIVADPNNPNLTEIIGDTNGTAYGYIDHSGTYTNGDGSTSQATYGITAADTFGVDYGSGKGRITGKAICSTQNGTNDWDGNATTSTNVAADFSNGQYCWCQLDGYTSPSGASQSLSAPWVFLDTSQDCASDCVNYCASSLWGGGAGDWIYRVTVFGSLGTPVASCDANVINITWDSTDASEVEANNAGSVTYDGNINTPRKAQHRNGYIFTGWTFNTPSTPSQGE